MQAPSLAASSAAFRDGDRWAAIGDSITHTGSYHAWIHLYHLTRFPARALDVTNGGIAGDSSTGALRRLAWDILPTQPTVATVMFGMNDVGHALYADRNVTPEVLAKRRAALQTYRQNMRTLVAALQEKGTRVLLLTPSLFDQTAELPSPHRAGIDDALAECSEFVQQLGAETGAAVIDLHGPMNRLSRDLQRTDPGFTLTSADRMHPGPPGHFVMAYLFLKAQSAPAEVARLAIDGTAARVTACRGGIAADVRRVADRGLTFTWIAEALPFPIDPVVAPALRWVPFTAELNQEILQVIALAPGNYTLRIDDTAVGVFSAEDFARGVNLAERSQTPQYRQAIEVARLVQEHRTHVAETLRNLALVEHQVAPPGGHPRTPASMQLHYERRMELLRSTEPPGSNLLRIYDLYPSNKPREAEHGREATRLAAEARRVSQPKPRRYEIAPTVA